MIHTRLHNPRPPGEALQGEVLYVAYMWPFCGTICGLYVAYMWPTGGLYVAYMWPHLQ